jgi:glycosyltransferase involved in cell wall biosynthesis
MPIIVKGGRNVNVDNLKAIHVDNYPVTVYYQSNEFRVILTSGLGHHNLDWLQYIKPTDILVCRIPWFRTEYEFVRDRACFEKYNIDLNRIYVLCNTDEELSWSRNVGFQSFLISGNFHIDYNTFKIMEREKKYDAVMISRLYGFKRHRFASLVENSCMIGGYDFGGADVNIKEVCPLAKDYYVDKRLSPNEVCEKVNESKVGLIMSAIEGACYTSIEYLLCGIPVVSTKSQGGRDLFYDDYNSLICENNPESVRDCVSQFINKYDTIDKHRIRNDVIGVINDNRNKFKSLIDRILKEKGVSIDIDRHFQDNFRNKFMSNFVGKQKAKELLGVS